MVTGSSGYVVSPVSSSSPLSLIIDLAQYHQSHGFAETSKTSIREKKKIMENRLFNEAEFIAVATVSLVGIVWLKLTKQKTITYRHWMPSFSINFEPITIEIF